MNTDLLRRHAHDPAGATNAPDPVVAIASPFANAPTGTPVDTELKPAAGTSPARTPKAAKPRDGFLDALRAVAIIRVVLWHAFGTPIISWIIATMPMMFFVAGSLLHRSLSSRPAGQVLRSRLKRLLVPFWFFGAIVLGFLSIVHLSNPGPTTSYSPDQLIGWLLPLVNPTASGWEAGWASSPLWYIRAYLWLLLLSPLLLAAWRRVGIALLPAPLVLMAAAEWLSRTTDPGPNSPVWILGDLGIYAFFVLLGFAHADGAFDRLTTRELFEWLGVAATAAFVAWHFFPAATGIINHTYPALWASGIAWIAAAFLVRPWLKVTPQIPVIGGILYWMTRRAMSIYLWHSPAIVGAYLLAQELNVDPTPTVLLALLIPLIVLAVVLTGWIEDVAGGQPAELWPTRSADKVMIRDTFGHIIPARRQGAVAAMAAGCAVTLIAVGAISPAASASDTGTAAATATDTGDDSGLALPPSPSGRPDPEAGTATDSTTDASTATETESDDDSGLALPPSPSGRPDPEATADDESDTDTTDSGDTQTGGAALADSPDLSTLTEQWLTESGLDGVRVTVLMPDGTSLYAGAGVDESGVAMTTDAATAVTSITKTMTGALTMQLVDEGVLDLDAPLTEIPGAGPVSFDADITIRQLLNHSSGMAPYQETPGYDAGAVLDPESAVALSLATDLQWAPGSVAGYSNSGFLSLGLIIEDATGQTFEDALAERILDPLGLDATTVNTTPSLGWVGDSAGGVVSTTDDLANWAAHLYRDGDVVSADSLAQMTSIDAALYSGLGTFPVCPCTPNDDGTVSATSYGHNGGSVTLQYSPDDGIVIAAGFSESFWLGGFGQSDVYAFLADVRAFANA